MNEVQKRACVLRPCGLVGKQLNPGDGGFSEILVHTHQTARCHTPQGHNMDTHMTVGMCSQLNPYIFHGPTQNSLVKHVTKRRLHLLHLGTNVSAAVLLYVSSQASLHLEYATQCNKTYCYRQTTLLTYCSIVKLISVQMTVHTPRNPCLWNIFIYKTVVSALTLLQYFQLPNKNSHDISRYIYTSFAVFQNSCVFLPLFLLGTLAYCIKLGHPKVIAKHHFYTASCSVCLLPQWKCHFTLSKYHCTHYSQHYTAKVSVTTTKRQCNPCCLLFNLSQRMCAVRIERTKYVQVSAVVFADCYAICNSRTRGNYCFL